MEIKGYTWGYYQSGKGDFVSADALASREKLVGTGIDWVCLAFVVMQQNETSTEILYDYRTTIPDLELIDTIHWFHEHGIKVCLKPMINLKNGIWRAMIEFPQGDMRWGRWFESYRAFLAHYAELAQKTATEMFCLGCEMLGTERQEQHWRNLIAEIRGCYQGILTYNTNHGSENVAQWYDAIDVIGTSGYYPVAAHPGASCEEMRAEWMKIADDLEKLSLKWKKPLMFAEIGCRSAAGCAMTPWDEEHWEYPHSEEEQEVFMESCLQVFSHRAWFEGFFWWAWRPALYHTREEAAVDNGFDIYLKKAENVIRRYYQK